MFPPPARHTVRIGEETRKLVKRLTRLLEPAIMFGMVGVVVSFTLVGMLLAIFCIAISEVAVQATVSSAIHLPGGPGRTRYADNHHVFNAFRPVTLFARPSLSGQRGQES